jgi:hypothetical protein
MTETHHDLTQGNHAIDQSSFIHLDSVRGLCVFILVPPVATVLADTSEQPVPPSVGINTHLLLMVVPGTWTVINCSGATGKDA